MPRSAAALVPVLLAVLPLVACMQLDTGSGADGGTRANPSPTAPAGSKDAGPGGTDCLQASTGAFTLCATIETCPGIMVDRGAYPDCGFRMGAGGVLDLECVCTDQLCPVGVASSCDQAAALLADQNELSVCQQVNEGRCVGFGGADAGSGGSGTCDTQCRDQCAGDPSCLQLCGC